MRADDKSDLHQVDNYGHGGSGWNLAVGFAKTAIYLLEKIMEGTKPVDANKEIHGALPPQHVLKLLKTPQVLLDPEIRTCFSGFGC